MTDNDKKILAKYIAEVLDKFKLPANKTSIGIIGTELMKHELCDLKYALDLAKKADTMPTTSEISTIARGRFLKREKKKRELDRKETLQKTTERSGVVFSEELKAKCRRAFVVGVNQTREIRKKNGVTTQPCDDIEHLNRLLEKKCSKTYGEITQDDLRGGI